MTIKLYQYQIPLSSPNWKVREGLLLQWGDGWGEIAPLPGFSRETLAEAKEEILDLLPNLLNAKPTLPSVRFGIASASKPFLQKPIRVPLCALGPNPSFTTVKLKLGHLPLPEAIDLVKRWLPFHRLRLDCNRAWSLEQALNFSAHFSPADFEYLEEPVREWEDLLRFSEETRFPIAVDESFLQCDWAKIPTLKAIVIKPTLVGLVPDVPAHLDLILSSSYETGVGLLNIAREIRSEKPVGLDTYRALQRDVLASPIVCADNFFSWQPTKSPVKLSELCLIQSVP